MEDGFADKVAIVTGAAQGIGAAVTRVLAQRNARVVAVDLQPERIASMADMFPRGRVFPVAADVSSEYGCDFYMAQALGAFGRIDMMVNNAGILGSSRAVADMPFAEFQQVIATNLGSVFLGCRAGIRHLRAHGGGAIVNMSSVAALRAGRNRCGYASSKAAIIALTKSAAIETGRDNIRVNAICPSAVDTPMSDLVDQARAQAGSQMAISDRPIPRKATPEEIANLVAYLLSDAASFQTGGVYTIDGGASA